MSVGASPVGTAMGSRWKVYPEYKDSGVEWLGGIPEPWEIRRLRLVCDINPKDTKLGTASRDAEVSFLPMEKIGEDGTLRLEETRLPEQVAQGYTHFRDGDVIVAKITPCFENGKGALCAGLVNGQGFGTTELHVLRPHSEVDGRYVFWLTVSQPFRALGAASMYGSAGQQRVSDDFVKNLQVPLPPLPEQQAIAAFLDRKTAKIDALIATKEQLVELLQEKRSALISRAVTKGLDPTAPMKDSGVEWLGEIPGHWDSVKLRVFLELQRGHDLPDHLREEGPFPLVSSAGVSDYLAQPKVKGPGVVTGRYGTVGKIHYIEGDYWPLNTTLYVVDFQGNYPKYAAYVLMTLPFDMLSDKSAVPGVNRNHLHVLGVARPPGANSGRSWRSLMQKAPSSTPSSPRCARLSSGCGSIGRR